MLIKSILILSLALVNITCLPKSFIHINKHACHNETLYFCITLRQNPDLFTTKFYKKIGTIYVIVEFYVLHLYKKYIIKILTIFFISKSFWNMCLQGVTIYEIPNNVKNSYCKMHYATFYFKNLSIQENLILFVF